MKTLVAIVRFFFVANIVSACANAALGSALVAVANAAIAVLLFILLRWESNDRRALSANRSRV